MVLLCLLLLATPLAAEPPVEAEPEPHRSAVVFDPTGPTLALLARTFDIPATDLNLRGHHMFTPRLGITAELEATVISGVFTVSTWHAGARVGPRLALRGRGLNDWNALAFVLGGVTTATAGGAGPLARYGVLGSGVELGRTWVWGHFTLDLGLGAYLSANVGYRTLSPAAEGTGVDTGLSLHPLLDLGFGYAW